MEIETPYSLTPERLENLIRERAELERALGELVEADEDYDVDTMTQWPVSQPVGSGERRGKAVVAAKALLARSAAKEGSERC